MRLRGGDIGDGADLEACGLKRADRGLTAGAGGALDEDVDLLDTVLLRLAGCVLGGQLSGERGGRLTRTLEATCPEDAQEITFPAGGSVMDTMVLLNVLLM